jgi:hypothetical protein
VLAFSPSGFPPFLLSAIIEEVASHGYIVVDINHTYDTTVAVFADGRVVPVNAAAMGDMGLFGPTPVAYEEQFPLRAAFVDYKTADIRSVVNQLEQLNAGMDPLAGRLDLTHLGALGHSMGGNAALEFCRTDARCAAGANLDGANWNAVGKVGLHKPALLIASEHLEYLQSCESLVKATGIGRVEQCEREKGILLDGWQRVYSTAQPGYAVTVQGARHTSFMNIPFLPVQAQSMFKPMLVSATIDSRRMWRITCDYLLAFFEKHLNHRDAPLLDGSVACVSRSALGRTRCSLQRAPVIEHT